MRAPEEESVYRKFNEATENMLNLHQIISKYSTNRKPIAPIEVNLFELGDPEHSSHFARPNQASEAVLEPCLRVTIELDNGWEYIGEIYDTKFHGFGTLLHEGEAIYSGGFRHGKMHGLGKLRYHSLFEELVQEHGWSVYEGEFHNGLVNGFGNLFLQTKAEVLVGCWREGSAVQVLSTSRSNLKI